MYYYTAARREYTASAKVSQFWVNPVLIVNCTFWKNIWQVSVFLFVISTQQSSLYQKYHDLSRWCLTMWPLSLLSPAPSLMSHRFVTVRRGSPAARSGQIQPGDQLEAVEGRPVAGLQHRDLAQILRRAGNTLRLSITPRHRMKKHRYTKNTYTYSKASNCK